MLSLFPKPDRIRPASSRICTRDTENGMRSQLRQDGTIREKAFKIKSRDEPQTDAESFLLQFFTSFFSRATDFFLFAGSVRTWKNEVVLC